MTQAGRYPVEPYSTGWFVVAYSEDVPVGAVVPLRYFGTELACGRGHDGVVRVFDAYCPHLGAHLGYGGCMVDDRVVCPFHEWEFRPDGTVERIPYSDTVNRQARLRIWETEESHGVISVWHSADGSAPSWRFLDVPMPELGDADFSNADHTLVELTVHPQEVVENVVDGAHFTSIHRAAAYPTDLQIIVNGHRLRSIAKQAMTSSQGPFEGVVDSELWGLGLDVNRIAGAVDTFTFMATTPVDERTTHVRLTVATRGSGNPSLDAASRRMVVSEFERDSVIWNNKRYQPTPMLAAPEKGITEFRNWAQQFYVRNN